MQALGSDKSVSKTPCDHAGPMTTVPSGQAMIERPSNNRSSLPPTWFASKNGWLREDAALRATAILIPDLLA